MADIRRLHSFEVLVICEPRISGLKAKRVIKRLGFDNSYIVEAEWFSGGIWLLWNECKIKIHVVANSRHSITALVDDQNYFWILTVVYANPCANIRRLLWSYLDSIRSCFQMPWLIVGDFNEITSCDEKRGGRTTFSYSGFSNWIDRNELVDMGFIGPRFTWMNKRGVGDEVWERLDRGLCSMEWRIHYSESFVKHLPRLSSDHCPVLIQLQSTQIPYSMSKPFRFEAMWLKNKDFEAIISNN